jgi:Transposase DDE domain group 1
VILADAACGSGTEIAHLLELNLSFIIKGFAPKTARRFAAQVAPTDWESIDLFTRVCDIGPQRISQCSTPVRTILVELMTQRLDRRYYSHLYTALSPQQADASQIFHGYNQRQSIEALVKTAKYGLSLTHLRTRSYQPIQNFLQIVALTFNLLSWFRHYLLAPLQLQDLGIYEITQKLMDIPAKCTYRDDQMILSFPANHPFTPALAGS